MALRNYTVSKGELWFSLYKTGTETPAGFRFLGNAPEFNITIDNETLDHFDSTRGIREKDASIVLETNATGSMTIDDIQIENLALFFFGSASVLAQTSATAQTETFTDVTPGFSYQLGIGDTNPTGVRSITNVVVEVGGSAKTVETDYTVDPVLGIVTIVEGGTIAAGDDVEVTYDRAAVSRKQVISGTDQVEGALRFISYSEQGERMDYYLPKVKMAPNGDFGLISDEWQQLGLSIEILKATGRERIYVDGRPFTVTP